MLVLPQVLGQTVPDDLVRAIGNGDAPAIDMAIMKEEYETSKYQAARILENFFKKHQPTSFSISFEGSKEESKYAIGTLNTSDGNFRVNMFFLSKEGKRLIYYLSIEKESHYELPPRT